MANNQMVSFPRELGDELGEFIAEKARVCGGGAFDIWEAICDQFGTAAPQPQGEPVAEWCDKLQLKAVIQDVIARERMRPTSLPDSEVAEAVYSAISEHLPVYEDVYDQLSEMIEPHVKRPYRESGTLPASVVDSLALLLRERYRSTAEQPAPVAVVLPERKPEPSCMTQIDDDREASIWNACLDEVTRLNAKP